MDLSLRKLKIEKILQNLVTNVDELMEWRKYDSKMIEEMKPYVTCYMSNYGLDELVWPEKPNHYNVKERCGQESQANQEKDVNEEMKKIDTVSDKDEIEIMYTLMRPSRKRLLLKDSKEWPKRDLRRTTVKSKGKQ
ncbi:hypothetical protein J1N35_034324 [Gossypium stocksii]|uniref:Uncharacterized protein n=1 Tax=Gossypium stocksii TaxID=47602 RepID=A0A9D3ZPZ2_9ROSI|nr:hypothetical protein J1N35_034324 [Gossypium stocksii]